MKFVPDADGWYHQGNGYPPCRLCPIDTTSDRTWADSILMRAKNVLKYGLKNMMHDGTEYPLMDFLYDTLGGDMPHGKNHKSVATYVIATIEYTWVMSEFYRIYGVEYFPVHYDDYLNELEQEQC